MKHIIPLCAFLLCSLPSCVNGKLNPVVSQIVAGLDTAGCELVTVEVSNVEAGEVCKTASSFFNGILGSLSAPTTLPAKTTTRPNKYPVRYQGVTVGHFYHPFDVMVQSKLNDIPLDTAYELTRPAS